MTDPIPAPAPAPAPSSAPAGAAAPAGERKAEKPGFTFTDPGCRTEVRVGALLVLAAVFLWLWLGPQTAGRLYLIGAPLLLVGIPLQALQARGGRPGFPWKLGIAFTVGALAMWPDLRWRETVDGAVQVQTVVPLLLAAGIWILVWWPVAAAGWRRAVASGAAQVPA